MYKQIRRVLQVSLVFWIFYISAISLVVYPAVKPILQDIVTNGIYSGHYEHSNAISKFHESEEVMLLPDEPLQQETITPTAEVQITEKVEEETQVPILEEEVLEEQAEPQEAIIVEEVLTESTIDSKLPGVMYLHIDTNSPEAPIMLLPERMSEDDVLVDISSAMDPNAAYIASPELELVFAKIVFREAGNQPFLGKLLVAEGVVSRIATGVYGSDIPAILEQGGYGAEMDSNGEYHVYHSDGTEVIEFPEVNMEAVRIALAGSRVSHTILEAATNLRNQQYGLSLGVECYRYGSIYHYAPELVSQKALDERTINRVPVSFRYVGHAFYGYWLNKAYAMNIV